MNLQTRPYDASTAADNDLGERAHRFGAGLVGVLSHPRGTPLRDVAVILFNAGLVQRVGPFRGYVLLARVLAAHGFPVLRFDQSGLGDSRVSDMPSIERRRLELHAAMALLTAETGVERFVLGGICSGADDAFHLAEDPRVTGVLLLDGLAYRTPGYWLRYLLPHLVDPRQWWRLLRRGTYKLRMNDYRDLPSRVPAAQQLARLVARDVRLLFLYTGGSSRYFNHRGQLAACLGNSARSPQVSLEHWPECDHTFYLRRDRARLQRAVATWLQAQFGDADDAIGN